MTTQPMKTHPITEAIALPGVLPSTKHRAIFWLNSLGQKPNALKRKVVNQMLASLEWQCRLEHQTYGHPVTK